MSRIIIKILFLIILVYFSSRGFTQNPVIPGYNPDPSICRVGDDYYVVTSSNEYFPGLPIYRSRNLINWEIIGYALNNPEQLNLDSVNCSGGIYAPTLRYNNGIYYIITTLAGVPKGRQRGNFIVTATNPSGPWTDPVWIADAPGIDPSLFFDDDGKVYYHGNLTPANPFWDKHRDIWVQEIDLKNMKLAGERKTILDGAEFYKKGTIDGGIEAGVNNFEAPHLYRKSNWYYLVIAHGGTFQNHAVSIWRSRNVFGPYEINPANPILTHRDLPETSEITSTGHADFVQTPEGDWWMIYHARRPYGGEIHLLGREVFISPVEWNSDWPVVNPKGKVGRSEISLPLPGVKNVKQNSGFWKDDFDGTAINQNWNFIRTPRTEWWSLNERNGFLRIQLRPEKISELVNPSLICRRQEQPDICAKVKMEFTPKTENEEAGLVMERDIESYFKFTVGKDNEQAKIRLLQKSSEISGEVMLAEKSFNGTIIYLQISSSGTNFTFHYSENGTNWILLKENVDGKFLGSHGLGRFTGTMIGMYASSNGIQSSNYADFDWFEITSGIPGSL